MPPDFPDAALLASRAALRSAPLTLVRGRLPDRLAGHLFVLSPVGTVDSGGAPYPNGNDRPTVINGDGMVWRFDFTPSPAPHAPAAPAAVTLTSGTSLAGASRARAAMLPVPRMPMRIGVLMIATLLREARTAPAGPMPRSP